VSKTLATDALAAAGLRTPKQRLCTSARDAVDFFRSMTSTSTSTSTTEQRAGGHHRVWLRILV
jgi:hypothetical protein